MVVFQIGGEGKKTKVTSFFHEAGTKAFCFWTTSLAAKTAVIFSSTLPLLAASAVTRHLQPLCLAALSQSVLAAHLSTCCPLRGAEPAIFIQYIDTYLIFPFLFSKRNIPLG